MRLVNRERLSSHFCDRDSHHVRIALEASSHTLRQPPPDFLLIKKL
jgi:hypothetical protein